MIIKNKAILDLYVGLKSVQDLPGAKFAYAVTRNIEKLKSDIKAIQQADYPSEKFIEFEKDRLELATSFAEKKDDKPVMKMENGVEIFDIKDKVSFEKAFDMLKKKHAEAIKDREKQIKDFNEIMKKEVEIDLYMIPQEYLPEDINSKELAKIMLIIKE